MDPADVVPWHLRGVTWQARKEYARADADYEKAAQLAGESPYASSYPIAGALLRAGCPDDKVRDEEKAVDADWKAHALTKGLAAMADLAAAHAEMGQLTAGSAAALR